MHKRLKRLLAAGSAIVLGMLTLAAPVAADDAALSDLNGDGLIDVFDFVMNKRVTVAENSPIDIAVSDAEGYAGETVTVSTSIDNNPGFSNARIALQYSEGLLPVAPEGSSKVARINRENFPDVNLSVTMMEDYSLILCSAKTLTETNGAGTLFTVSFQIPEDALPGTTYSLAFQDIEFSGSAGKLPLLTERGKITVLAPDAPKSGEKSPELPTTTSPAAAATTAAVTTATTALQTVTASASTGGTTAAATQTSSTQAVTMKAAATGAVTSAAKTTAEKTTAPKITTAQATTVSTQAVKTSKPFVETATTVTTIVTTTVRPYLKHGIDISSWQGDSVDFNQVKTDPKAQFVILRAGFGKYLKQTDTTFYANYDRATAAGIPVGAYWYSYAKTPEEARIEANVCVQVLGDRKFDYPIAFDIEEPDVLKMDIEDISAIIDAFCSEMEKNGYFSQIYCSSYYLNNRINQAVKTRYDVWVANYNVTVPSYTGAYGMWQYGLGEVTGFENPVDVDYCYRDYPAAIKRAKLNGYK